MRRFSNYLLALVLLGSFTATALVNPTQASAVSPSQWQPGYIIDDSLFFFSSAMGANDIQTFLSAKVPICDTNGTQPISPGSSTTRAQWAAANGKPQPPYTCLKDYVENITLTNPDAYCANGISGGTKSAAMIISEVAWACGINPQVLIVLLQKEQGLVTDDWPWPRQYQFATGFCVYDTGSPPPSCEGTDGFFRQVYYAARQFQRYVKQPQSFNYRAGVTSNILWNVASTGCGGANVYVQNGATAALYNYTPYQPNQASLNAGYGSGDGCSSYGNRNFWLYFNDWFGPTLGSLVKTPYDNTVYLLNGTTAHPISDPNLLNDFAALGPVRTTSASEINTYSSGPVLGRMVGDTGGTLYLVNAGIKLPFTSCDSVSDYGYSCGQVTYLTTLLLNKLVNGPSVTPLIKSVSNGTVYYVIGGIKRPIVGWGDLLSFHTGLNTFTDAMVDQIPTNGIPAYGSGTLVKTANSPTVYIVKDINNLIPVSNFIYPQELGLNTGIRTIASSYTVLNPIENKIKCAVTSYIATNGVRFPISSSMMINYGFNQAHFIDSGLLCQNVVSSSQWLDRYIRTGDGSIYYINSGQKQPFTSYSAYQAHGGNSSNTIQVSDFFASSIPTGATLY